MSSTPRRSERIAALKNGQPGYSTAPVASSLVPEPSAGALLLAGLGLLGLRRRNAEHAGRAEKAMWRAWSEAWSRPGAFTASGSAAVRASEGQIAGQMTAGGVAGDHDVRGREPHLDQPLPAGDGVLGGRRVRMFGREPVIR